MKKDPQNLMEEILAGKILIYPTDTIYGLGCDATNEESVKKIREIKSRDKDKPLSIIAPSMKWIEENCIIEESLKQSINKYLPGPYTLILKKKNSSFLPWISSTETIGIRIPYHEFTKSIQQSGVPFVTTSVNLSGEPFLIRIEDLPHEIAKKVDYIIESKTELSGKPSTLIINGKEISRD